MSFADAMASMGSITESVVKKIDEDSKSRGRDSITSDDTFWSMDHLMTAEGTGRATIRFLPPADGEVSPYIEYVEHIFEGPGGWYVNRSRMDLGRDEKDPIWEYNGKIFKDKSLSEEQRKQKLLPRKRNIIASIFVVDDPVQPENNGKIFRFKFGPQIFNIILAAMKPDLALFPDQKPLEVFNPVLGANFEVRVYKKRIAKGVVPSYEKSSFHAPTPLVATYADYDALWKRQYPLNPLKDSSHYVSYPELKARFDLVMSGNDGQDVGPSQGYTSTEARPSTSRSSVMDDEIPTSFTQTKPALATQAEPPADVAKGSPAANQDDDWFMDQLRS